MSSNTNVLEIKEIISPNILLESYKPTEEDIAFINESRNTIRKILHGEDIRLLVVVGPCSIHDYDSALEYATYLKKKYTNIFLVMRVYFEKPRSRTGWKGFIYDPDLNDTFDINKGLGLARQLLLELTKMRIPIGCEFLDTITPQYLSDLVSWGAIGARTSESQIHRQLASGLSMPIGFKNLTSGDYEKAIDGIVSAAYCHNFLGVDEKGIVSQVITKGNSDGHLILRGGLSTNYQQSTIQKVVKKLQTEEVVTGIIVDCSHGNSQKEYNRQILVALYVKRLRFLGYPINGIMLESNIKKGNQKISLPLETMKKGVSITDACIDVETTLQLLQILDETVVYYPKSLSEIRTLIREYDVAIANGKPLNKSVMTDYMFEEDAEIASCCKGLPNEELLLMNVSMRLALSEKVAELKFQADPFKYLLKSNDLLSLITDREVEKDNLHTFNNPLYLKIMELSKNLQVKFLEKYIEHIKIGYLFGIGSFSHEAVQNFRGNHISYDYIGELNMNLINGYVDYILVPTYNSIIGDIDLVSGTKKGSIEHRIELNLYSNVKDDGVDTLYIEPHIQKEAAKYIEKLKYKRLEVVKSSIEGCRKLLESSSHDITIASAKNESNFLYTIDRNIVEHNITTFSLF